MNKQHWPLLLGAAGWFGAIYWLAERDTFVGCGIGFHRSNSFANLRDFQRTRERTGEPIGSNANLG